MVALWTKTSNTIGKLESFVFLYKLSHKINFDDQIIGKIILSSAVLSDLKMICPQLWYVCIHCTAVFCALCMFRCAALLPYIICD